jgi:hypothetical protein
MAEEKKSSVAALRRNEKTEKKGFTGHWRFIAAITILLLVIAALVASTVGLKKYLFTENPRLTLREVTIKTCSNGFWNNKSKEICRRLELKTGANLFKIDPEILRLKLESIPGVSAAEVLRIPPDTIEIRLNERMPRATVANPGSPYVIDEDCVVIPRLESMASNWKMPIITGIPLRELKPGTQELRFKPAIDLIMTTMRGFPDIKIMHISLAKPDKIEMRMTYCDNSLYTVIVPVRKTGLAFLLSALQSAIITARRNGDTRSHFDLSFDGQVILK